MSEVKQSLSNGDVRNFGVPSHIEVVTANKTIDINDGDKMFQVATDALTITLPAVGATTAPAGFTVGFMNTGADGNNLITLSPNASDAIYGTIANAAADSVSGGVDDKDWINTKATANKGDYCILQSDGSTGWYIVGGVGTWASEA